MLKLCPKLPFCVAGRTTLDDPAERVSATTLSSCSASTDLPPLNSEMQADASRIAAMLARAGSNPRSSFGGALGNASDSALNSVRTLPFYARTCRNSSVRQLIVTVSSLQDASLMFFTYRVDL
jgi:hypothetical protein